MKATGEKDNETVAAKSLGGQKGKTSSNSNPRKKPREKITKPELHDTPLSEEKGDELSSQVETPVISPERMDFIRKTRVEKKRLLKKCGVALWKIKVTTIVQ